MSAVRDQQRFKAAARRFASGVTVVTVRAHDEVHGITASSFCSLSLDPLLVTVAVHELSRLVPMVGDANAFAISVLDRSQRDLSHHFAMRDRPTKVGDSFGAATYVAATGAPIIAGCIAYFDCRLHSIIPGGDHRILVGEVVAAGESHGEPLLYFEGEYHGLGTSHGALSGPARADGAAAVPSAADGVPAATSTEPRGGQAGGGEPRGGQPRGGQAGTNELLAVQQAVEPSVAELAARAATDDDLSRLRSLLDAAATAADDARAFTMLSLEFHVALADATHNRRLRELAASLRHEQQQVYEPRTDGARALRVQAAHEEILSRVSARDDSGARAAMAAHVDDMQRHVAAGAASAAHPGTSSMGRTSIAASVPASMESPR